MKTLRPGANNDKNDATAANKRLMGHNRFGHQTLYHAQNHIYTEASGKAAKEMKHWLGYPAKQCDTSYGDTLNGFLTTKKLTPAMTARRIARKIIKPPSKNYINPIKVPYKKSYIGGPGIGTHSWVAPPNNWQSDNAVDIAVPYGTPLVAVSDGKIGNRIGAFDTHGDPHLMGLRFYLEDIHGRQWYYAHASKINVKAGEHVKQGQTLALSGRANGVNHLHIACDSGNPLSLLPK